MKWCVAEVQIEIHKVVNSVRLEGVKTLEKVVIGLNLELKG